MRRALWLVMGVALVAGGCSTADGDAAGRGEEGAATDDGSSAPPGPQTLWCGEGSAFPVDALDGPTGVEAEEGPVGDALRTFLADPPPDAVGTVGDGWRRLLEEDDVVILGTGEPPTVGRVELEAAGAGWEAVTWGGCALRPFREGMEAVGWDPSESVDPGATEIEVVVTESGCASGQEPGDRLQPPEVVVEDDAVTVTFWVVPLGGAQECPGNPPTPVTVTLDEPLGERALLDGGAYPARLVRPA